MGNVQSTQSPPPRHPGSLHNHYSDYYPRLKYNRSLDPLGRRKDKIKDTKDAENNPQHTPPSHRHPSPLHIHYSFYYPRIMYNKSIEPLVMKNNEAKQSNPTKYTPQTMAGIDDGTEASDHAGAMKDRAKGAPPAKHDQTLTGLMAVYAGSVPEPDHHHVGDELGQGGPGYLAEQHQQQQQHHHHAQEQNGEPSNANETHAQSEGQPAVAAENDDSGADGGGGHATAQAHGHDGDDDGGDDGGGGE